MSFYFGFRNSALSRDASVEVRKGSAVCSSHRCTLDYNRTNSSREGEDRATTLTVMVTAENGYDDHEYTLMVSRAAPIGDEFTREHFLRVDVVDGEEQETPALGDGDGKTVARAFTMETRNATGSSMNMRIDLVDLGDPEEGNEYCAQRVVMVKEYNDDDEDALDALNPPDEDNYEDDVCRDTRYRIFVNRLYEIEIESEDSVSETYYLNTRNRDRSGDAELESLEIDGDAISLVSGDTTYSAVEAADTVTVEWETADENARVLATPRDTDSGEDGHQFALGDPNETDTLTIRVISENSEDTAHYVLDIRRANNVATLASLAADVGLNETFSSSTSSYTADAAHNDAEVVFNYTLTDTRGSTNPASPHTAQLGAAGSTTTVSIVATAEDGSTSMTYTIAVTRGETPPDPTAGIVLMQDDAPFSGEITEGTTDTVMAELSVQPSADSTVTVNVTAGTGLTVVSGGTLSFTSTDWSTGQEVVLEAAGDDDAEEADPADLMFAFSGDAAKGYSELTDTVEVTITETDTKGFTLSATAKEVTEGASGTYTIAPTSQPVGGNIIVEVTGAPSGVTVTPSQVVFTDSDWDAETVTINTSGAADDEDDGNETFTLRHGVLGGGYTGTPADDVDATVVDDEAPQVVITTTAVTVNEGATFTYTVTLTQAPSADETVTVDLVFNTGDFSASATSVTLTAGDFEEEVTITAKNVTADAVKTISHTVSVEDASTGDQVYDGSETASSISVTVSDVPN